ncbi:MAG: hypothetical protein ACO3YX_07345, partial [Candidatus Nanopelagicaceae bacterium]
KKPKGNGFGNGKLDLAAFVRKEVEKGLAKKRKAEDEDLLAFEAEWDKLDFSDPKDEEKMSEDGEVASDSDDAMADS